jgi:hypothetical protein
MSAVVRRNIPQLIVSAIIVLMVFFYFFYFNASTSTLLGSWDKVLTDYAVIVVAIAAIVGGVDILRYHVNQFRKREGRQVLFSSIMIVTEITMVLFAFFALFTGVPIPTQANFAWLYTYMYAPCDSAMYSILLFYMASASYRTFRARNPPALLLLVVAFLVILGNTSLGEVIWGGFLPIKDWIMTVPNTAAFRPITIGLGFGIIILGMRLIIGKETTWMGRRE